MTYFDTNDKVLSLPVLIVSFKHSLFLLKFVTMHDFVESKIETSEYNLMVKAMYW